ncbi:MAG: T9SS type A sorting domain-containing protein [Saprospiraceae bacterium]|nr:T9SS type A sorting domain-containing protein [Saprospiraceae bacterium]
MLRKFLLFLFVIITMNIFAQSPQWKSVTREEAMGRSWVSDENVPLNNLFTVNFEALNAILTQASRDENVSFTLEVPVLDGKKESYKVLPSSVMEPELQVKYPLIRTFKLVSLATGSMEGRIGISPEGFYGIIDIDGHEVLINKVNRENTSLYSVFRLTDNLSPESLITPLPCGDDFSEKITGMDTDQLAQRSTEVRMRHFRVGIATTSSFVSDINATTIDEVLAKIVQIINQVNLRYNKDFGMHLDLIANTTNLFNMTKEDDFFRIQNNGGQLLGPSQDFFNMKLQPSDYDFGQTWTTYCTDVGGVVSGSACNNQSKARGVSCGPTNVSYFLQTVKHEMGHQFSASHTFNSCNGSTQQASQGAYEPGSGSTIMSYAGSCGPDNIAGSASDYFHVISILQVREHNKAYATCGTDAEGVNTVPEITLPTYESDLLTIPQLTPYELVGNATDAENDHLYYIWEEFDQGNGEPLGTNFATGPLNRTYPPNDDRNIRMVPTFNKIVTETFDITDRLPQATREMNWKFVVRDYNTTVGGVAIADFKFKVDSNAGPFKFTFPDITSDTALQVGQYVELKWDVANTDKAPVNAKFVDIFYSINGGADFTDTLALRTPNDGAEYVMLPRKAVNGRFKIKGSGSIFLDISKRALRVNEPDSSGYSFDVYPHNALMCPSEPKNFIIKGVSWKDFNKEVKVELVDGWPQNTIISLDKENLVVGEPIILHMDTRDVTDAGFFTIRIRATAEGQDTLWRYLEVEVLPSKLEFKGAVNPAPGEVNAGQVQSFTWNTIPGADTYEFQLANDSKFENILESYSGTDTSYHSEEVLPAGTVYYWRVRAFNRCFDGPWSEYNSFQTILFECNTISALGLPKNISSNVTAPPVDILFDISNNTGVVADINVKNINISHSDISKLKVSAISPSGKEITLVSERCAGISGMLTSFDDVSPLKINCGQIKANRTFKPEEALSEFNGEPVQGSWSVRITTLRGGSSGKVNNIDFDLCASISSPPIVRVNNNVFKVNSGNSQVLENKDLLYTCEGTTEDNIRYILLSEPKHGYFTLYGQEIHQGDGFLQGHLNDWAVRYVPYDPDYEGGDQVDFLVRNDKFAYLAPVQLNIDLNKDYTVSTKPLVEDLSKLVKIYPNPTNSLLNIDLSDIKDNDNVQVTITDISGKKVMFGQKNYLKDRLQLDLSQLTGGIYFVQVSSGNFRAIQKIVKF